MKKESLQYAWLTLKHKFYVLQAGLRLRVPLKRLILHDVSKLTSAELPHYGRQFFGDKGDKEGWNQCWLHHMNNNDHHWEYWVPRMMVVDGYGPLRMPEVAVREMVADWLAACKAYDGEWPGSDGWKWYKENFRKLKLHSDTRQFVMDLLRANGIDPSYEEVPKPPRVVYAYKQHAAIYHRAYRNFMSTLCGVVIQPNMIISDNKPEGRRVCMNCG